MNLPSKQLNVPVDPSLLALAKSRAAARGLTLKQFIDGALRLAIAIKDQENKRGSRRPS